MFFSSLLRFSLKILFFIFLISIFVFVAAYVTYSLEKENFLNKISKDSKVLKTDLGEIEYKIYDGGKEEILHIHGSPGGFDQIFGIETKYKVINPSRPGYLRTPIDSGATPEQQADLYNALLNELGIDSVFVMGTSGGGPSAIAFAIKYPEKTRGLISFEALTGHWIEINSEDVDLLQSNDFVLWLTLKIPELLGRKSLISFLIPDPINQKKVFDNNLAYQNLKRLVWGIWPMSLRSEGFVNDYQIFKDLSLNLEQIKVPTIAIHGTEDINVDVSHSRSLVREVVGAKLFLIEGADHYMMFSHEEKILKIIEDFINENL